MAPAGSLRGGNARPATVTSPRGRKSGSITAIAATAAGALHADTARRIAEARHVYFFVHGFANSFPEAITRAAFNRDWYAQEGGPAKDALAVTFTWPSPGKVFGDAAPPSDPELAVQDMKLKLFGLPGTGAYFADQKRAADSGDEFVAALALVRTAFESRPRAGRKFFLMAHSMGHIVMQHALGRGDVPLGKVFDETFFCAGDAESERLVEPKWIAAARRLSGRVHIYYSENDSVLRVSDIVNGRSRLGFLGRCGLDKQKTPGVRFIDCSATIDRDREASEGNSGHYYYRRVDVVRAEIAAAMNGKGAPGLTIIPALVQDKLQDIGGNSSG